jgi:two-component sensor histidine kinase
MVTPITKGKRFLLTFICWWLIWIAIQSWLLVQYGVVWKAALTDSVVTQGLLAAFCLLVVNNMQYYLPKQERYWYILIVSVVLSSIHVFLVQSGMKWLLKNDADYLSILSASMYIRYIIVFLMIGCMSMISLLWYTLLEQQENEQRKEEAEKLRKDAELLTLQQQLQPHFLFNSLNSISALAGSQPERARHMIQQLSDFLRGTLKREEHQYIALDEELKHLALYLDIEKVRFGHRLNTSIELEEACLKSLLPTLILQPLVENAIKFGLYDTTEEVLISIKGSMVNEHNLQITVENPFDPVTAGGARGTGFGLNSIKRRLYLLYARQDLLQTSIVEQRFTTTITIPQYAHESHHH